MAKRASLEERIAALHALAGETTAASWSELRKALRLKNGLLVATAADVLGGQKALAGDSAADVATEMVAAFSGLLEDPVRRDPGCRGTLAIARVMRLASHWEDDVFAPGLAHVQPEPVWGGSQDTAADLRGECALAYAELLHPAAVTEVAAVLADPERATRAAAAVALGNSGRHEAIPLLRYKVAIGDDDPEVHAAALRALLAIDPDESVPFVARFLDSERAHEAAALALGESRHEGAFAALRDYALSDDSRRTEVGFIALAMLRSEAAVDLLVEQIGDAPHDVATRALLALAPFCVNPTLRERALDAAKGRGDDVGVVAERELD